jgi:hypothetical protein
VPNIAIVKLLVPHHTGKSLPLYQATIDILFVAIYIFIKLVSLGNAGSKYVVKIFKTVIGIRRQAQPYRNALFGCHSNIIVNSCLGAGIPRIDGISTVYNMVINTVFMIFDAVIVIIKPVGIGFVIAKQQGIRAFGMQPKLIKVFM